MTSCVCNNSEHGAEGLISYPPLNCGRIVLAILATADMVGQTAHLSRAARSRVARRTSRSADTQSIDVKQLLLTEGNLIGS